MPVTVSHVKLKLAASDIVTFRLGFRSGFQLSPILRAGRS